VSARCIVTSRPVIPRTDCALICNGMVVGMVKHGSPYPATAAEIKQSSTRMTRQHNINGQVLHAIWDCVRYDAAITELRTNTIRYRRTLPKGIVIIGMKKHIYIHPNAVVHPGVVLDASTGPVTIDEHACLRPHTTIAGPSYIGPGTIIDRAKITASSIGPMCRIGGEVEACIFQGYSNKYHEGFIGHSFVGEWVNLGALTTNSDLKNNYGPIRVVIRRTTHETGMTKLGCFIGDHTKTGIGTLIPTGAVIGSFVNFFGGGVMPRYVPDFTWLTGTKKKVYSLNKALETARVVLQRRGRTMTPAYQQAIQDRYSWRNS
jgi:UDP-N-acetylglucosamine diphosphorylase/glucosamine-1-phosphate N-acetyltransferase